MKPQRDNNPYATPDTTSQHSTGLSGRPSLIVSVVSAIGVFVVTVWAHHFAYHNFRNFFDAERLATLATIDSVIMFGYLVLLLLVRSRWMLLTFLGFLGGLTLTWYAISGV